MPAADQRVESSSPVAGADGALHLAIIDRGAGRRLRLFSRGARSYRCYDGLPPVTGAGVHLRQHPLMGEWIAYSAARQGRTMLPSAHES